MRIVFIILTAVMAMMGEVTFWLIIKLSKFIKPFTNILVSHGVIQVSDGMKIISKETGSTWFSFICWEAVAPFLAYLTRPTGFIVYIIATLVSFIFVRPSPATYSPSLQSIDKYITDHGQYIDEQAYMDDMQTIMNETVRGYIYGK